MPLRYLLYLYLYFKGITFFKTSTVPANAEFIRAEFRTVQDYEIHFSFYREEFCDLVYRRKMFNRKNYTGYIIQARFDDRFPESLTGMNSMKFLFKDCILNTLSDRLVSNMLLDLYLEYIQARLEQNGARSVSKMGELS